MIMARKSSPTKEKSTSPKTDCKKSPNKEHGSPKQDKPLPLDSSIEVIEGNSSNTSNQELKVIKNIDLNHVRKFQKNNKKHSYDKSLRSRNKRNQYDYCSAMVNNVQASLLPPANTVYYPQVSNPLYACNYQTIPVTAAVYQLPVIPVFVSPYPAVAAASCYVTMPTPTPVVVTPEVSIACVPSPPFAPVTYYDNTASSSVVESYTGENLTYNFDESVTEVALSATCNEDYLSIEFYLQLPKTLFPPARLLSLDPNPIIDIFCKNHDVLEHTSWILDLEFGIPKVPLTRPIPIYDVQYHSINCKNTPGAIHPGFESCSQDFKSTFLHYYDSVISTWYRGYVIINNDHSVENFQSFLSIPAQQLGMCWP